MGIRAPQLRSKSTKPRQSLGKSVGQPKGAATSFSRSSTLRGTWYISLIQHGIIVYQHGTYNSAALPATKTPFAELVGQLLRAPGKLCTGRQADTPCTVQRASLCRWSAETGLQHCYLRASLSTTAAEKVPSFSKAPPLSPPSPSPLHPPPSPVHAFVELYMETFSCDGTEVGHDLLYSADSFSRDSAAPDSMTPLEGPRRSMQLAIRPQTPGPVLQWSRCLRPLF